VILTNYT